MSYNKYYSPTTWEDFPSENTAINAQRLNHLEDGVDKLDGRICALDVNKSQVSWNQQLLTGDKIAEISINGVVKNVYAPNVDGASQQAQAAALVSEGHAQGTQGGSAVGPGSQYYHNNAKYYAEQASTSFDNKIASEGYALGTENGDPVTSGSIYYHNNAKYYAEQARSFTPEGYQELVDEVEEKIDKSDVDVKSVTTGKFDTITGGLMQSCIVDLELIQSGSGTPSPSNVRAITGHTSVSVGNCGKNILDYTYPTTTSSGITCTNNGDGTYTLNGTATANLSFLIKDELSFKSLYEPHKSSEMKLLGCPSGGGASTYRFQLWRDNGALVDTGNGVTIPSNALASSTHWNLVIVVYSGQVLNNLVFKPMITKDLSATYSTYEPYKGYTTTINLGGTYYGGTLDAVSGVLTVTHKLVDMGSYTWNKTGANLFYTEYPRDFKKAVYDNGYWYANGVCECYKFIQNLITSEDGVINLYFEEARSYYRIFVNDSSRYSLSASDFKTAVTGQKIAYELATPFTIQLTPTQLETLVGQNDVFAPLVGQTVESLTYREVLVWDDVEKAINIKLDLSSVAPIEYTDKASQSYNQKQLFIKDNKLCQALASISSGASFTENTNFKYTTLAEIIEPLIP